MDECRDQGSPKWNKQIKQNSKMSLVEEIEMNSNCNKQINNTKIVFDS